MRTRKTLLKLIAVSILVVLPITWAMSRARVSAQNSCPEKTIHFGMTGIVQGQTIRLNVVNFPPGPCRGQIPPDPCRVEMEFHDSQGNIITPRDSDFAFDTTVSLAAGKSTFLDLNGDLISTGNRVGIIPCIKVMCGSNDPSVVNNVVSTAEVFDNSTGRTSHVIPPDPCLQSTVNK